MWYTLVLFPAAFVLPSRDSLSLGERIIAYIPRCADTNSDIRKVAIQVSTSSHLKKINKLLVIFSFSHSYLHLCGQSILYVFSIKQIIALFFNISLSLPKSVTSSNDVDLEVSYSALSSLEDVISILRRVSLVSAFSSYIILTYSGWWLNLSNFCRMHPLISRRFSIGSSHLSVFYYQRMRFVFPSTFLCHFNPSPFFSYFLYWNLFWTAGYILILVQSCTLW